MLTARDVVGWGDGSAKLDGEVSGAAFWGDIALIDIYGNVVRSVDDGSTWTVPKDFIVTDRDDTNIAYDSNGTLYITNMSGGITPSQISSCGGLTCGLVIARATGLTTFTAPHYVGPIANYLTDRPWMTADKSRPNFLYAAWHGATSQHTSLGYFTYCHGGPNGTTTCDNDSAWCTPWALPVRLPPQPYDRVSTYLVESGAGAVWLALGYDTACDPIPSPYDASVGIRKISNWQDLGASCTTPDWSSEPVQCLYYRVNQASGSQYHPESPVPDAGVTASPGNYRRWSSRLQVSQDGNLAVTLQALTGVNINGNDSPCTSSYSQCRLDVFTAIYSPGTGWCLPSGGCSNSAPVNQTQMYRANRDSFSQWVDHTVPATMIFNYGIVANSWYDFRNDPVGAANYQIMESFVELADTGSWWRWEEAPPSSSTGWWDPGNGDAFYGDIDTTALSPQHAFIARQLTPDGTRNGIGYLWSPDAYLPSSSL